MNRKLTWLPIALLVAVAGCNEKDSGSTSTPAASTTSTSTTNTTSNTTTSGGVSAGAAVETPAAGAKEVTTPSGLKYEDLVVGTGLTAENGMSVSVKYIGWLTDGTKFDSGTYPLRLGAHEVIRGWEEGLVGMKVGGKRKLTIPPDLGYAAQGNGPVPPNATLIFEVELVDAK